MTFGKKGVVGVQAWGKKVEKRPSVAFQTSNIQKKESEHIRLTSKAKDLERGKKKSKGSAQRKGVRVGQKALQTT